MDWDEVRVGLRVVAPADSDDVGVVERIAEGFVWVRFPVAGGLSDLMDLDPGDLERAEV